MSEFIEFPKTPRLSRRMIITEKIDGTNACVYIADDGVTLLSGSRSRWLTLEDDNFGFARWCHANHDELLTLGPGRHFAEWWGAGIGRKYGLTEKRFSLFNTELWGAVRPACCHVVPVLYDGIFDTAQIELSVQALSRTGSLAAPGFMRPEGVMVFHTAANISFKKTIEKDEMSKGEAEHRAKAPV